MATKFIAFLRFFLTALNYNIFFLIFVLCFLWGSFLAIILPFSQQKIFFEPPYLPAMMTSKIITFSPFFFLEVPHKGDFPLERLLEIQLMCILEINFLLEWISKFLYCRKMYMWCLWQFLISRFCSILIKIWSFHNFQ